LIFIAFSIFNYLAVCMGVAPTIAIINRKLQDLVTHRILNFNRRRADETTLSFYLAYFNMSKNLWKNFCGKNFLQR